MSKRRRGSSLIEFALGIALLAPVAVGVARLGATAFVLSEMQAAVREGAEFASQRPLGLFEPGEEFLAGVRNVVVYGRPEGGSRARVAGLLPANVRIAIVREGGLPKEVVVSIAGYSAPGGAVRIDRGPQSSFPYRGRIASY